jgi:hypothetical protein
LSFGIQRFSDGSEGLSLAMVPPDSAKDRLFFGDLDKFAIDGCKSVGRCAAGEASSLGLARTSRTEPQRDHRPFVFRYGAEDLSDHLS